MWKYKVGVNKWLHHQSLKQNINFWAGTPEHWQNITMYKLTILSTGHFIRYTLLVLGWTFCLQNCLNSSWHRFNKVSETFLRDFVPYWHDSIMQLRLICRLHIHDANLPCHHIPKVLYWDLVIVEAIWVKRTNCHVQETSLRWFEICDMVHYPAGSSHQNMGRL